MKHTLLFLTTLLLFRILSAQTTLIPDSNFEQALINLGYDVTVDGSVATANINTVINLDVSNADINDLTGIEDFTSLTTLYCNDNQLTSLNLSYNVALVDLRCYANQISSLDLSNNTTLDALNCNNNQLTNLVLSNSSALTYLNCHSNQLASLVVDNQALSQLICHDNPLLITLYCNDNQLTSLDLSTNVALEDLRCQTNQFTSLDLSNNINLDVISCSTNQLTSLDLSDLASLTWLECQNNQLTSLDMRNGNNTNVNYFNSTNNPSLLCIEVDNEAWSTTNWTNIDSQSYFSEDCSTSTTDKLQTQQLSIFPNPTSGIITVETDGIESVDVLDLYGKQICKVKENVIDLSKEPDGIYIIKVTSNKGVAIEKIIKQ